MQQTNLQLSGVPVPDTVGGLDFLIGNIQLSQSLLNPDDFGTGYSNFHYLYNLKPDCIKVDRGLMKNALSNDYENLLLKHMIDMAHSVGVNMCIEGIETEEELHKVLEMGSDFIQGFYYSKPLPFNEITDYLKNFKKII